MRVNNVTPQVVFKTTGSTWNQEEYDKMLQKRADATAKTLMIVSGLATAGYFYTITKCKDKGGIIKCLWSKIKNWFENKTK